MAPPRAIPNVAQYSISYTFFLFILFHVSIFVHPIPCEHLRFFSLYQLMIIIWKQHVQHNTFLIIISKAICDQCKEK